MESLCVCVALCDCFLLLSLNVVVPLGNMLMSFCQKVFQSMNEPLI